MTCSPAGGWIYLSDGTKLYRPPDEDYLASLPLEERKRIEDQNRKDQAHLSDLYGGFRAAPPPDISVSKKS